MAGQLSDFSWIFQYEILLLMKVLEYLLHLYAECWLISHYYLNDSQHGVLKKKEKLINVTS